MFRAALVLALLASAIATAQNDGRIVGGVPAKIQDFPYQISLIRIGSHICGGSIISANYILTAAHCVVKFTTKDLHIRAGSDIQSSGGQIAFLKTIITHPNYNNVTQDNDMALLELTFPLKLGGNIQAIKLPEEGYEVPAGKDAVVSGWGSIDPARAVKNLRSAKLKTITRSACRNYYDGFMDITERMICTLSPGYDACQGDSGGPLVLDGKLIGVVSWGVGCARPDKPGVYANVANLRKFIRDNANV